MSSRPYNENLNVLGVIVAAITMIVALAGIAIVASAGASVFLVQLADATSDVIMTTSTSSSVGEGEQEGVSSSTTATTTINNASNAVLGSLFLTGEDKLTSFNPINETHTEVSYAGNITIMPPDATTATTINATETGNLTLKLQPNCITIVEGQSLLVTEG